MMSISSDKQAYVIYAFKNILFTKSRGYSNIKNYNFYQTNVINLKQLVLISKVIPSSI